MAKYDSLDILSRDGGLGWDQNSTNIILYRVKKTSQIFVFFILGRLDKSNTHIIPWNCDVAGKVQAGSVRPSFSHQDHSFQYPDPHFSAASHFLGPNRCQADRYQTSV